MKHDPYTPDALIETFKQSLEEGTISMINWLRTQYARLSDWQRKRKALMRRAEYLAAYDAIRASVRRCYAQGIWTECEDCDGLGTHGRAYTHECPFCEGSGKVFRGL